MIEKACGRNMVAGIQRFISYIYAYENGEKSRNAGYAKIEIRGNAGRMEIYLQETDAMYGTGKVCFVCKNEDKFFYIPAGEFTIENRRGACQISFNTLNIMEIGKVFDDLDGIYIMDASERMYLSFWKEIGDINIRQEKFIELSEERQRISVEPVHEEISEKYEHVEEETLHTMEVPVRNVFPKPQLGQIWEEMQKNRLSVQFNKDVNAVQIELRDLRELPKDFWYLGNNSFLLHGFFNYHYLLFGKLPEGGWFLGVPGIYQKQERVMASIFGFPGFLAAGEVGELQPGAWYHVLED